MLKCYPLALLLSFAATIFVHAQDQSGFISIDCGIPENSDYTDSGTGIYYVSDAGFIESGSSYNISQEFKTSTTAVQHWDVTSFPQGTRNCYTLRPASGKGNRYLIRASFMYGNYDNKSQVPQFDVHLGVDPWFTVELDSASSSLRKSIIHVPTSDYIYVCLVNTDNGTPFISTLELRPLDNSIYESQSGSLDAYIRRDLGSSTGEYVRYQDDIYDRLWSPFDDGDYKIIGTTSTIDLNSHNHYQVPSKVMTTAITPKNASDSLHYSWEPTDSSDQVYIYMHFAEVEMLLPNQHRSFYIYLNGELFYRESVVPSYLYTNTIYSTSPQSHPTYDLTFTRTQNSTHPPIINAIEVYIVKNLSGLQTDEKDVAAINSTKYMYGLAEKWQGDPCSPRDYAWDGLNCSYDGVNTPRIISLNLSSSNLTGKFISPFILGLTMIQSLDLSNNNLTGDVPDFLSFLTYLRVLNLKGNNFTGSVPAELLSKSNNGSLLLSIDVVGENTSPSQSPPLEKQKKKNKFIIPVVASVIAILFVLLIALIIHIMINRRKKQPVLGKVDAKAKNKDGISRELKKNRQFTYSEVLAFTNNFHRVIGKGGFGTVYHGHIGNTQVAVKMLSPSCNQGYKEFQTEAKLLMSVHHKNLTSLVGYCNEGTSMGIIYEYMALGDLARHLSGKHTYVLSWSERLQIAMDAAQGLEYLHHGCKPPIIHRDVKSANILLNENFRAKLADFGMSRVFPAEDGNYVSTIVVGTPGYLDPEYSASNRLTEKSDVYSYGIVLLEIITGRPPISKDRNKTRITQWVNSMLAKGDVKNMVDPRLDGDFNVNSAWKAVELATLCASRTAMRRPTMNYVVTELRECMATERARPDKELDGSIGVMPLNVESDMSPSAR